MLDAWPWSGSGSSRATHASEMLGCARRSSCTSPWRARSRHHSGGCGEHAMGADTVAALTDANPYCLVVIPSDERRIGGDAALDGRRTRRPRRRPGPAATAAPSATAAATMNHAKLDASRLRSHNVTVAAVRYPGQRCGRSPPRGPYRGPDREYHIDSDRTARSSSMSPDRSCRPAPPDVGGPVGIGFRIDPKGLAGSCIRPTNGRANHQVRRNRATRYSFEPK